MPHRQGQGGHPVPHRPLPPSAPTRQGAERADPGRAQARPCASPAPPGPSCPGPRNAGAEPVGHIRLGYARASTARQSLNSQLNPLAEAGVTRVFSKKISSRATRHPELLGRGVELATLAEELKASDVSLESLAGELQGSHDPSGVVFTVLAALSGMEREYIRDRTLEGHESARKRGKAIGGAGVTDDDMLSMALHLREQER
ncbi:recombinase family protein [Streptomyces klenkii]|uniref:recombinase family protein n=1 Tax=Streptomyces klenkii TaxID=1420899 RepID=UPI00343B0641